MQLESMIKIHKGKIEEFVEQYNRIVRTLA